MKTDAKFAVIRCLLLFAAGLLFSSHLIPHSDNVECCCAVHSTDTHSHGNDAKCKQSQQIFRANCNYNCGDAHNDLNFNFVPSFFHVKAEIAFRVRPPIVKYCTLTAFFHKISMLLNTNEN